MTAEYREDNWLRPINVYGHPLTIAEAYKLRAELTVAIDHANRDNHPIHATRWPPRPGVSE